MTRQSKDPWNKYWMEIAGVIQMYTKTRAVWRAFSSVFATLKTPPQLMESRDAASTVWGHVLKTSMQQLG